MGFDLDASRRFPEAFMTARIPSFADFLASYAPDLLPGSSVPEQRAQAGGVLPDLPHATTIVTAVCEEGVVIAGDRRSTTAT